jgi:DNA repair protein RecN (Recombination protein N)
MLEHLEIHDFALIDRVEVGFGAGFNVLTGETGAGKSIIIDAIGALLGNRVGAAEVRSGARTARVAGTFVFKELRPSLAEALHANDVSLGEDGRLLLSREIAASGRTTARIQGRTKSVGALQQIAGSIIDIHGQGENLSLLRPRLQLEFLDRFAGLDEFRQQVGHAYRTLQSVQTELQHLQQGKRELAQRADLLAFQIQEIAEADLTPDEEETLHGEYRRLRHSAELVDLTGRILDVVSDAPEPAQTVSDQLAEALRALQQLSELDPETEPYQTVGEEISAQLAELAADVRRYADSLEQEPARMVEVEERLDIIEELKRKYGDSVAEILAYADGAAAELASIQSSEDRVEELAEQIAHLTGVLATHAADLSARRKASVGDLVVAVHRELELLGLPNLEFNVAISQEEASEGLLVETDEGPRTLQCGQTGIDSVAFLISPNPGEPLKPLAAIASGGEASRLLLALKSALAHADDTPVLIFDEIEIGVGGRSGAVLGEKLWSLVQNHQVICVTHLPQVAAYADHHYFIHKAAENGRTLTQIETLAADAQVAELLAMGGAEGAAAERSTRELLRRAQEWKHERGSSLVKG